MVFSLYEPRWFKNARTAGTSRSESESAIQPGSLHAITFGGEPSIVIPSGPEALSDAASLSIEAFANLAVSLFLPLQRISNVSVHSSAQQINYIQTGNEVSAPASTRPLPPLPGISSKALTSSPSRLRLLRSSPSAIPLLTAPMPLAGSCH